MPTRECDSTPNVPHPSHEHYTGFHMQSDASAWSPAPKCCPGTRVGLVSETVQWACHNADRRSFVAWIYGPAGVGKSAVARSCVERVDQAHKLGAAFFFSQPNCHSDPSHFVLSIARQLATNISPYRDRLDPNACNDPALAFKPIEDQFQELIVTPFRELRCQGVDVDEWVIIIDGLDECKGEDAQRQIITMVAKSIQEQVTPLVWAFFSRPEPHITSAFESQGVRDLCWQVPLLVSREADKDIKLYLLDAFEAIREQRGIPNTAPWPSDEVIHHLVTMSAGFFSYAATVVKFVEGRERTKQLSAALGLSEGRPLASSELPFSSLDQSYTSIMQRIPQDTLSDTQLLLLAAIVFQENASEVLDNILGSGLASFHDALHHLHSVVSLQESDSGQPVMYFYHQSFIEFLLDPGRSGGFCINIPTSFTVLLQKCLRIINSAHHSSDPDSTVPDILLSHDIRPIPSTDLKWLVYKTVVKNLFKLWLLADLDPDSIQQLQSLDFTKILKFKELHESGIWQVYEPDLIHQVSQKSGRILRPYHSSFFAKFRLGVDTSAEDSDIFPTYVIGHGKRRAFLVPQKLLVQKTQYVLAPKP